MSLLALGCGPSWLKGALRKIKRSELPIVKMHLRLLRTFLGLGAITWGAAFVGVILPWDRAVSALEGFGAREMTYDPMMDYWRIELTSDSPK